MKTITISTTLFPVEVQAHVFGDWGVHWYRREWRVTHVPSGTALCVARDERHGKRIARRLAKDVPTDSLPDTLAVPDEYPLVDARARDAIWRVIDDELPILPDGPHAGDGV